MVVMTKDVFVLQRMLTLQFPPNSISIVHKGQCLNLDFVLFVRFMTLTFNVIFILTCNSFYERGGSDFIVVLELCRADDKANKKNDNMVSCQTIDLYRELST